MSPRSYDIPGLQEFFNLSLQAGELIMWAADWIQLADSNGVPDQIAAFGKAYGFRPLLVFQFFSESGDSLLRPLSDSIRSIYLNSASRFAGKHSPEFLGFGIEVNRLNDFSPSDFDTFVNLFAEVADEVHLQSPATKVFTVFQLEKMKGLNGGLFGGVNDTTAATWFLAGRFPNADLIAFSSYPSLVFHNPENLPPDYYMTVSARLSKRVAFTEVGWHSESSLDGWESSESEQQEFVVALNAMIGPAKPAFVIWTFLFDPDTSEPFHRMGLRRRTDGQTKTAWPAWLEAFR